MVKNYFRTKPLRVIAMAAATVFVLSLAACGGGGGGGGIKSVTPPGGTSPLDPYQISEPGHLVWMAENTADSSGKFYELVNDIVLPKKNWTPIGDQTNPFVGNFYGAHYTISNLTIKNKNLDYAGLFGVIDGGTVKDLGLEKVDITGGDYVGAVAGLVEYTSSIRNCSVSGAVSGVNRVGGVAGYSYGDISSCYSSARVTGAESDVGGVVGRIWGSDGKIRNCYATGNVTGGDVYVGGVVGSVGQDGIVENSYATGEVSGYSVVGGVVGYLGDSTATIKNCVALNNKIMGPGTYFGRVAGAADVGSTLTDNVAYEDMLVQGAATSGALNDENGLGLSKLILTDFLVPYYADTLLWDFSGVDPIWKWGEGIDPLYKLPVLDWQTTAPPFPGHLN